MSKKTWIIVGILIVALIGLGTYIYLKNRSSADITQFKKEVKISSFDFVPGEMIVKILPAKSDKLKAAPDGKINSRDTGISDFDQLNKKFNVEEVTPVINLANLPSSQEKAPSFKDQPDEYKLLKVKFKFSEEDLKNNAEDTEQLKIDQTILSPFQTREEEKKQTYNQFTETSLVTKAQLKTKEMIEEYNKLSEVEYAEPNYIAFTSFIPNDPKFPQQWAHQNTQAEQGWDIEKGNKNTVIAIIDTGVDYRHEDLTDDYHHAEDVDNIWRDASNNPGFDLVNIDTVAYQASGYELIPEEDYTEPDNDPSDFNGHGTHVSGIAAAVTDNNKGVAGVCQYCKIMPLRAGFSIKYYGMVYGSLEYDDIFNAVYKAINNRANIINMSFGSSNFSSALESALNSAYSAGITLVAAAGNSNTNNKFYPAAYNNVIAVAATDISDTKAYYSNYGSWVDVAAPGSDIVSTVPRVGTLSDSSGYKYLSGSSMASPYVAGLAGLILSKNPSFNNQQIENILKQGINKPNGQNSYIGTGIVNIQKALNINSASRAEAKIFSPRENEIITAKKSVNIIGKATGSNYKVEYGKGFYTSDWTEIGSGTYVDNGLLVNWNIESIPDGDYTIKLTVNDDQGFVDYYVNVNITKGYKDGWPYRCVDCPQGGYSGFMSPTLYDLNKDGNQEIIIGNELYKYFTFFSNGTLLNNWPVWSNVISFSSAVGDLENDGKPDIIVSNWRTIQKLDTSGNILATYTASNATQPTPALSDINNDGELEIIGGDNAGNVFVLDKNLNLLPGWPVNIEGMIGYSSPAIGDIDNDGNKEIVITTERNAQKVIVLKNTGAIAAGWPKIIGWGGMVSLADIDNDNDLEIFASDNHLYAWHHDGRDVEGFPVFNAGMFSPAIGDLDRDGNKEIVGGRFFDNHVYAVDNQGRILSGWPEETQHWTYAVSLANIDEDREIEIVAASRDGNLYGWEGNGNNSNGFPKKINSELHSFPAIRDIDRDGHREIVVGSQDNKVHVFKTNTIYDPLINQFEWPTFKHDPQRTGNASTSLEPDPSPTPSPSPPGSTSSPSPTTSPEPTPTPTPTPSPCTQENLVSSEIFPNPINPGNRITVLCGFGKNIDSVYVKELNKCNFIEFLEGTSARFDCESPQDPGYYKVFCSTKEDTVSNSCAGDYFAGEVQVVPKWYIWQYIINFFENIFVNQ